MNYQQENTLSAQYQMDPISQTDNLLDDKLSSNAFLFLSFVFADSRLELIFNKKFHSKDQFLRLLDQQYYSQMLLSLFEVFNSFYLDLPTSLQQPKIQKKQQQIPMQNQPTPIYISSQGTPQPAILQKKKSELEISIREIIQKDFQPLKRQISQTKSVNKYDPPLNSLQQSLDQLFNEQNFNRFSFGIKKEDIVKKDSKLMLQSTPIVPLKEYLPPPSVLNETQNKKEKEKVPPPRIPSRLGPKQPHLQAQLSQSPSNQDLRNYVPIDELPKKKKSSVSSQRNFNILTNEES